MEEHMNLYDWLKEKDNDYDTYDTVYDICVTVCVPYEGLSPEWYDKFSDFVLKHVEVVEETSDFECIADWNEFIEHYKDIFKMITAESWNHMPDDEDFNYEWIREIDKLLTGYGSEKTYHYLMDIFTENTKED